MKRDGTTIEKEILHHLRMLISSHRYREGDKLPPERQLAEELKVSRRALRNAFSILEAEGKVWRGVGQGTFVGKRHPDSLNDLAQLARTSNPSAIVEARLSFEPIVARFAAQRVTSANLQEMKEVNAKSERAPDLKTYELWDEAFHRSLVTATHNSVFEAIFEVISNVWGQLSWGTSREKHFTPEWQRIYTRQHRAIVEAVESRDLDRAENLMLEHWQTIRSNLIRDPGVKTQR